MSWNTGLASASIAWMLRRFNGATTVLSWNTRPARESVISHGVASMGPRRCCRGIPICTRPWSAGLSRFNGATTVLSWNTVPPAATPPEACTLQWGHDGVVVEYDGPIEHVGLPGPASMGPRRCCRGIHKRVAIDEAAKVRLQWGHDGVVVEYYDWSIRTRRTTPASMGPRRCCRGIPMPQIDPTMTWAASMGPRRCCRGIRQSKSPTFCPAISLQWGHDGVVVEYEEKHAS